MRALAFYLFYRMAVHVLPLLVGVSVIVFAVVRLIPGDAVDVMNDRMPIEQRELIRLQYGLDEPIWTQYALWLGQALQGNLGTSLRSGRPVAVEIGNVASASLELGLFGALIGIGIGLPAGILAAIHHNRPADSLLRAVTYVSISVPEFWLGAVLILMLGIGLGLFPISGYESIFIDPARALRTGAMPAFALGLIMAGFLARVTRSAMLEVMHQDYVIVARSKGLPPRTVLARHARYRHRHRAAVRLPHQRLDRHRGGVRAAGARPPAGALDLPARLCGGAGDNVALHDDLRRRQPGGRRVARRDRPAAPAGMRSA